MIIFTDHKAHPSNLNTWLGYLEQLKESLEGKCCIGHNWWFSIIIFFFSFVLVTNLETYTRVSGKTTCATGKAGWGGWPLTRSTLAGGSEASRYRARWLWRRGRGGGRSAAPQHVRYWVGVWSAKFRNSIRIHWSQPALVLLCYLVLSRGLPHKLGSAIGEAIMHRAPVRTDTVIYSLEAVRLHRKALCS